MDDPWGSPWATTDSDKDPKLASPSKSDLAPPPRAFLSASSSPRIPAASEQSPWGGDDDEFGGWTTTSDAPSGHGVWAGGWGGSSPNLVATPRDDGLDKESPIAWPGALATQKPANGSAFRHPSPDPWASEFSEHKPLNEGASTPRLVIDPAPPVEAPVDVPAKDGLDVATDPGWDTAEATAAEEQATPSNEGVSLPSGPAIVEPIEEDPRPRSSRGRDVRTSVESCGQRREYQSSTNSNDNTDHEDERQESPITSIDEELRVRHSNSRPGSRKASGKVQELVDKFDGLSRAASEERTVPLPRGRSTSPLSVRKRAEAGDTAEFGGFEDADQDGSLAVPEPPPSLTSAREAVVPTEVAELAFEPAVPQGPFVSPITKFGPMSFPADLALIDKLFDSAALKAPDTDVKPDEEVPDYPISDSFTEISQRKTWYRISRLGSSRRHNAADDESYRRVAWRSSTVHDDTIKIVRRWMEEDSIAGRVTLGGGVSKTQKNMFGWDSSAEPVALDAVFGRRNAHSRASSLQHPSTGFALEGPDGSKKKPVRGQTHRPSGSAGAAVASFGWSSDPHLASTSGTTTEPARVTVPAQADVHTAQVSSTSKLNIVPKHTSTITNPLSIPSGPIHDQPDDDDDEWGEMVSSPAVSNFPTNTPAPGASLLAISASNTTTSEAKDSGPPPPNDPWGSADFSVFDSAPSKEAPQGNTPTAIPSLKAPPVPGASGQDSRTSLPSQSAKVLSIANRSVSPSKSLCDLEAPSLQTDRSNTSASQLTDLEETAQSIITNLPDLSYMLR